MISPSSMPTPVGWLAAAWVALKFCTRPTGAIHGKNKHIPATARIGSVVFFSSMPCMAGQQVTVARRRLNPSSPPPMAALPGCRRFRGCKHPCRISFFSTKISAGQLGSTAPCCTPPMPVPIGNRHLSRPGATPTCASSALSTPTMAGWDLKARILPRDRPIRPSMAVRAGRMPRCPARMLFFSTRKPAGRSVPTAPL